MHTWGEGATGQSELPDICIHMFKDTHLLVIFFLVLLLREIRVSLLANAGNQRQSGTTLLAAMLKMQRKTCMGFFSEGRDVIVASQTSFPN